MHIGLEREYSNSTKIWFQFFKTLFFCLKNRVFYNYETKYRLLLKHLFCILQLQVTVFHLFHFVLNHKRKRSGFSASFSFMVFHLSHPLVSN